MLENIDDDDFSDTEFDKIYERLLLYLNQEDRRSIDIVSNEPCNCCCRRPIRSIVPPSLCNQIKEPENLSNNYYCQEIKKDLLQDISEDLNHRENSNDSRETDPDKEETDEEEDDDDDTSMTSSDEDSSAASTIVQDRKNKMTPFTKVPPLLSVTGSKSLSPIEPTKELFDSIDEQYEQTSDSSSSCDPNEWNHISFGYGDQESNENNNPEKVDSNHRNEEVVRSNSDVIDLLSSSSDDLCNVVTKKGKNSSESDVWVAKPLTNKTRARRLRIETESSNSNEESSTTSDIDAINRTLQESFIVDLSDDSSDASLSFFAEEENDTMDKITKKMNTIEINSSEDDDDTADYIKRATTSKPKVRRKSVQKASKKTFSKQREQLAQELFKSFDQAAFGGKLAACTKVEWSKKLRTTAGLTRMRKLSRAGVYEHRSAVIELSTKVIDEKSRLRSTLLHEMCHAAAFLIDGISKPPHGRIFQKWAKHAMKCVTDVIVTTTHSYEIEYKYAWACTTPKCQAIFKRHSRCIDVTKHICSRCKGKLIEIDPKSTDVIKPRVKAPPSAYNMFVKTHSAQVRQRLEKDRTNNGDFEKVLQKDVMAECARLWRKTNQHCEIE